MLTVNSALPPAPPIPPPPPPVGLKWNPGHYMQANGQFPTTSSNQSAQWTDYMNLMPAGTNPATGKSGWKGWTGFYSLFDLDQSNSSTAPYTSGNVNTTLIDNDLAQLASLSASAGVTFHLIIQVMSESFYGGVTSVPTTPQSDGAQTSIAPDHWISPGLSGQPGGDVVLSTNDNVQLALYRTAVWQRYAALLAYLGSKYDSNPLVEAIIPISENGFNFTGPPSDYSVAAYRTAVAGLFSALATSWPTTQKFYFANFGLPNGGVNDNTNSMNDVAAITGCGFGGPDVLYLSPYAVATPLSNGTGGVTAESYGEATIRGEGSNGLGNFGSTVYKGKVGINYIVEDNAYGWTNQTSAGSEAYGYTYLGITHFGWTCIIDSSVPAATQYASGILPALQAVNFRINSTYPSSYPT